MMLPMMIIILCESQVYFPLKYMIDISNKWHYLNALYNSDGSLKNFLGMVLNN